MDLVDRVVRKLRYRGRPREEFISFLQKLEPTMEGELLYQMLVAQGFPLVEEGGIVYLQTARTDYRDQKFVVVDIETNGSKPGEAQIIEIGAVKSIGGRIVDRFESLVYAREIPEYISNLTGISPDDLEGAPSEEEVLLNFKGFLGDALFIAHNVLFDYSFISSRLDSMGLGRLANRRLCSIDLAKRTIESRRYGLGFLNEVLGINREVSHRAYSDALTAHEIFKFSLERLPLSVRSSEDLIEFSRSARKIPSC
ncbi:MAG: 3'-5' exonuclease [Epsilonproteobacteria bacterium]|nr:DNA polymerase III subunit epsilon [Campylobacterota bacterium]NPA56204.1 3'-5' exonuclease [Campylobacterota bacterium]